MLDDRQLDQRKAAILSAVVQQYIETAQPVGSSTVSARTDVAVSSATVRNDMTLLEREGYLVQPHTSAGRIPTEKGYRFFVDNLTGPGPMNPTSVRMVREFFATAHGEIEQMLAETSRLLSDMTGTAAVVVSESHDVSTIRSVQLIDLATRTVLAIMVMSNGVILKRTIDLDADVDVELLADANLVLAGGLVGATASSLATWAPSEGVRGAALAASAASALADAVEAEGQHVFVDGRSRIAGSFDARETIESVLGLLEQQFVVVSLLKELVDGGLAVSIGSESGVAPLAECSLVVAPYAAGGEPAGAIAVLGPTRMNYPETLSAVAVVSQRLSNLLSEG
ncbi:MAG: heat-inducible transcriptional repressor HrcA [Actinomycetota bacterium]|nr:heat-inducible transcriptional repressor HrcA [Actinomycetota bacterium]